MGSARRDLRKFPKAVRNSIGLDLYTVQCGMMPDAAKPFKGLKGVMEIVERYATDTYRALYVATLDDTVYVLHCFKKEIKAWRQDTAGGHRRRYTTLQAS